MTAVSQFPFLRLPTLAQDEVQNCMTVIDLFKLSMTSAKAKRVVKAYTSCYSFEMDIFLKKDFKVCINDLKIKMKMQDEIVKIDFVNTSRNILEHLMKNKDARGKFVSVWEGHHMKVATKHLIEYFAEVFNKPVINLSVVGQSTIFVINIIRLIKKLNLEMNSVKVKSNLLSDALNDFVLNECKDASILIIDCETTEDFGNEYAPPAPFQTGVLRIAKANWVKIAHLNESFIDVNDLKLRGCHFNCHEILSFLKKWIEGSSIKYANLTYEESLHSILDLLKVEKVPYETSFFPVSINTIDHGNQEVVTIDQKNGERAWFFVDKNEFILTTDWEDEESDKEDEDIDVDQNSDDEDEDGYEESSDDGDFEDE